MDWDAMGAIGETLGATAVVITLGFLVQQMKQANMFAHSEAEREWGLTWQTAIRALGENEHIAGIMLRGLESYYQLSAEERVLFHTRVVSCMEASLLGLNLSKQGLIADQSGLGAYYACLRVIKSPGGAEWWADVSETFGYKKQVDRKLAEMPDLKPLNDLALWQTDQRQNQQESSKSRTKREGDQKL